MTERLYYNDARLRSFSAQVVAEQSGERGLAVQLDRSAFYPTSGGQPHDLGALNGVQVLDVWADGDGNVWHLLERPLEAMQVSGEIDWERRFDHMQQHTGQHMLSAAFLELFDAPTISFHLGSEGSTIDLDIPSLSWDGAFKVEEAVNRVVWEDRPVRVRILGLGELGDVPLRKPPQVEGKIRVIWVESYDASACGGTHVERTGEIGLIKIISLERYKGGVRVGFLCGRRALGDYRGALRILQETSADLSVHQVELRETVARLSDESRHARRTLKHVQGKLLDREAQQMWIETPEVEGIKRMSACFVDRPFEEIRQLALRLRERTATIALFAVRDEKGMRLVCARSDDLVSPSAGELLTAVAEALGGRGGGSPTVAQGGAPEQSCERVLEVFEQLMVDFGL